MTQRGALLGLGCVLAMLGCDGASDSGGTPDSGARVSLPDASSMDGGRPDSSTPDASSPDGGLPDASSPDGSISPDVAFSVRPQPDGEIVVEAQSDVPLMHQSCSGWDPVLEKRVGETWQPLQDDRHPPWSNPGYFLDGEYVEPSFNLGCDYVACELTFAGGNKSAGYAREYVKTGTQALSSTEMDAGVFEIVVDDPADVVETRAFHGHLRVRFMYSLGEDCEPVRNGPELELDVP